MIKGLYMTKYCQKMFYFLIKETLSLKLKAKTEDIWVTLLSIQQLPKPSQAQYIAGKMLFMHFSATSWSRRAQESAPSSGRNVAKTFSRPHSGRDIYLPPTKCLQDTDAVFCVKISFMAFFYSTNNAHHVNSIFHDIVFRKGNDRKIHF